MRLHFCETFWGAAGSRTFDVTINGTKRLSAFDIFATAGGKYVPTIQSFLLPSNASGQFVIAFGTVKDNPWVNGIEIDTPVAAPVVGGPLTVTGTVGLPFSYQINATNHPSLYAATNLPSPLSVNTTSGIITGTPTASGTSSVSLKAYNIGGNNTATLTLTVNPAPPVINTVQATSSASSGSSATFTITATGAGTITYQWSKNGTPITGATNPTYIIGSATTNDAGTYTITATDSYGGSTTSSYTLTVNNAVPIPRWILPIATLLIFLAARHFLGVTQKKSSPVAS